ncbi:MAG: hypothetical protein R3F58_10595 [Steroidobacteraceae bacterium]
MESDIASGSIIPLRHLIAGTGPNINQHVNLYYLQYWSLTHFLFHYSEREFAGAARELAKLGGSVADFERLIGPIDEIQTLWYSYFLEMIDRSKRVEVSIGF